MEVYVLIKGVCTSEPLLRLVAFEMILSYVCILLVVCRVGIQPFAARS